MNEILTELLRYTDSDGKVRITWYDENRRRQSAWVARTEVHVTFSTPLKNEATS